MAGLDTTQVQVAAGSGVFSAPAGTAAPTLGTAPATPWVDLGYISDDGITNTRSRSTENFGAWQTLSPIVVLLTGITDTFAFSFRQWSSATLAFVYGSAGLVLPKFAPAKTLPADTALLFVWQWLTYNTQLWVPRGKISGDTESVLTRTAPSDLPVEIISTPSGAENVWQFESAHPGVATLEVTGEAGTVSLKGPSEEEEAAA